MLSKTFCNTTISPITTRREAQDEQDVTTHSQCLMFLLKSQDYRQRWGDWETAGTILYALLLRQRLLHFEAQPAATLDAHKFANPPAALQPALSCHSTND